MSAEGAVEVDGPLLHMSSSPQDRAPEDISQLPLQNGLGLSPISLRILRKAGAGSPLAFQEPLSARAHRGGTSCPDATPLSFIAGYDWPREGRLSRCGSLRAAALSLCRPTPGRLPCYGGMFF